MEKVRLLGVLCIFVIALVSASTTSNDPLASNLLNAVFILSCGVIGVWLLRKIGPREPPIARQKTLRQRRSRRVDLPVEFPLTDRQKVIVLQDRRRLADRRRVKNNLDDQKDDVPTKIASN